MRNEYEVSEVVEVGKAEDTILGEKDSTPMDDPGLSPAFLRSHPVANYDE